MSLCVCARYKYIRILHDNLASSIHFYSLLIPPEKVTHPTTVYKKYRNTNALFMFALKDDAIVPMILILASRIDLRIDKIGFLLDVLNI